MPSATQNVLKIVNPVILVLFTVQAAGGMLHEFIPYAVFAPAHTTTGVLVTIGIAVHVIFNRTWFKTAFRKKTNTQSNRRQ